MKQLPTVEMPGFRPVAADPGPRSFRIDLGQVAAAQAVPVLDVRSFSAAAGTSIGAGLEGLGKGLGQIAEQQMASINRQAVNGASVKLEEASNQIAALFEKEQDERKWPAIFQEEAAKWKEVLLKDTSLSPVARDAIEQKHAAWQVSGLGSVARSSHDRTLKRELEDREGARITAIHRRQFDEADSITAEQESLGLISSGTAAKQRVQTADMREKLAEEDLITSLYDEAANDPRAFKQKYAKRPEGMPVSVHARSLNHAQQLDREAVAADADNLETAIITNVLTVPEEVANWEPDNPRISLIMREEMKAHLIRRKNAMEQERQRANAPENMSRLLSEISDLDPAKSTDEQFLKIDLAIKELPEGYRDTPYRRLHRKWRQQETPYTEAGLDELGDGILDSMLKSGAFGKYENEVPVKDKNGNPVLEPSTQLPKTQTVRDPKAWESAIAAKSTTGGKLARWLKANPKATPEQVQARLYEIAPESTRAGMFDEFDRIPNAVDSAMKGLEFTPVRIPGGATTPGDPRDNEMLPNNPGPPENILLPSTPPPNE